MSTNDSNAPVTRPNYQASQDQVTGQYTVPVTKSMTGEVLPANTVPAKVDAANRAWRTLVPNIAFDILIVVAPVLYDAFTGWNGAFTAEYWFPVGVSLIKTAALVIIAYVLRLKRPPVGAIR